MDNTVIKGRKVSFLGMGIMGSAMAFNLIAAGVDLRVWNRNQSRAVLAVLAKSGGIVCPDLKDCISDAELIFTCLGDEKDVLDRLTGEQDSVLAFAAKEALVVDFSTIGPEAARAINSKLGAGGVKFLDAPVTGGDVGAKNATLTIMIGGEEADFERALPFLNILGKNIRYCGPCGSGQALKLCNQILCAVNMISVCEAFTLADQLNLDRSLVVDVLSGGAGGSWALSNLGKRILQDDLKPAFSLRNMLKDLRLVFASLNLNDGELQGDSGSAADGGANEAVASLPGTALSARLFALVAGQSQSAADDFGTQSMIKAYLSE